MKVYSIGREEGCDIVINDNSDVISRRHATLTVTSSGKMTIVDLSHNGTYVNGIRISANVPVPVTRKDNVSFAHVARLDWNLISNPGATIVKWAIIGVVAILLVVGGVWGFSALSNNGGNSSDTPEPPAVVDSLELKKEKEKIEEIEKQKQDSIKQHVQDSLAKVRQKTPVKSSGKTVDPKHANSKKDAGKKDESKGDETKKRFR